MDEQMHARALVESLSTIERAALRGLARGESIRDLATSWQITPEEAGDVRDSIKWKLGVTRDVDAVRIALTAWNESAADASQREQRRPSIRGLDQD